MCSSDLTAMINHNCVTITTHPAGVDYPSIAISQVLSDKNLGESFDFALAKSVIFDIAKMVLDGGFPLGERKFLNINIPQIKIDECRGYKITQKGFRLYGNDAHLHKNPRGEEHYWLGVHPLEWQERVAEGGDCEQISDFSAIKDNYISITPITLNMTSYKDMNSLEDWLEKSIKK